MRLDAEKSIDAARAAAEKASLIAVVREAMERCEKNSFAALGHPEEKIWVETHGGFAAGDDPYFAFYKKDIGSFFLSPAELFERVRPGAGKKDEALSVMSVCFVPNATVRAEQAAGSGKEPCLRWIYARASWDALIKDVSARVTEALAERGIRAAAADLDPQFRRYITEKYNVASSWSHRHAAFVAGLGTFGLCDGLISRWGKAVRFSSFILDARIPADARPYKGHHDWCLFYAKGRCDACMKACPAGAITEAGHDKTKCQAFMKQVHQRFEAHEALDPALRFGCGLCQGAVPCQKGVPGGLWKEAEQQ